MMTAYYLNNKIMETTTKTLWKLGRPGRIILNT